VPPYQYSIDNGLSWNTNGVFPNLTFGSYPVLIMDALGCVRNSAGTIDTNSLMPQPDFLISTSPQSGDTLVVVDISNPRPDSASWDFPAGTIIIDSSMFAPVILPADTGTFIITMHAFYGSCEVILSRSINVGPFDPNVANPWSANGIDSLIIYPNPNSGIFNFSVTLEARQSFVIITYDAAGNERTRVQVADADSWTGIIAVPNPVPGNYALRVIAEYDSKVLTFVIAQ
jgi:hypothetical protein